MRLCFAASGLSTSHKHVFSTHLNHGSQTKLGVVYEVLNVSDAGASTPFRLQCVLRGLPSHSVQTCRLHGNPSSLLQRIQLCKGFLDAFRPLIVNGMRTAEKTPKKLPCSCSSNVRLQCEETRCSTEYQCDSIMLEAADIQAPHLDLPQCSKSNK